MTNLTPEQRVLGRENADRALGMSRRDLLKAAAAAPALGAFYFGYKDLGGKSPVRAAIIGTGDEGCQAMIRSHNRAYLDFIRETLETLATEGKLRSVDTTVAAFSLLGMILWIARWFPAGSSRLNSVVAPSPPAMRTARRVAASTSTSTPACAHEGPRYRLSSSSRSRWSGWRTAVPRRGWCRCRGASGPLPPEWAARR